MLPDTIPTTTEKPALNWVVSNEIYIKGQVHPSNSAPVRDRLTWGVLLQVAAMQLREYDREHNAKEKEQWQTRINQTIQEANRLNSSGRWGYQDAPLHPMPEYPALNVEGIWLEALTGILTKTFGSAIVALTLKIN